jgi:hypothetical protein
MKRALLLCLFAAGCSRDLSVPPLPQPGAISGRIVYATPGRSELKPAAGAVITLIGSGLSTTANQAGTFLLGPLEETEGLLHFTFDSDGDGVIDRQKVEQLSAWKTGVNRQVSMGDVALGENAAVRGKVLLADRPGAKSGLSGSAIFVPEGPFAAYTADDGSFVLPNLPEGPLQFYVFREGYAAKAMGTIALRAAEEYSFRDIVLTVSTDPPGPGSIVGGLTFFPEAFGTGDSAISAQKVSGAPVPGVVSADFTFRFEGLPQGLYTLSATRTGYTRTRVFNVLVLPLRESSVGAVLLTDNPELDGGEYPAALDAGTADGGLDGGACVGPNCTPCLSNAQCSTTQWCDNFYCAPQCSALVPCSNGRACDSVTKTCVTPCGAGCPSGQACVASVCRSACDGSFMCSPGFVCDTQNHCVPECATEPDCGQQHLTCVAGQCVPKGTCTNDLDCASDKMCLVGLCQPRPTARVDGGAGPFACTSACNCKLSEWCTGGVCLPDVLPTLFFATDGDGGGTSMLAPSSALAAKLGTAVPGDVLALRRGDRFYAESGFALTKDNLTVVGGFEVCGAQRWVRSDVGRTTLAADAGIVVQAIGTLAFPIDDARVRNVSLEAAGTTGCNEDLLTAEHTRRLEVSRVEGALLATNDCLNSGTNSLVQCTDSQQVLLSDLTLKSSTWRRSSVFGIDFIRSEGTLRRISSEKQSTVFNTFGLFRTTDQTGPIVVQDSTFPESSNSSIAVGISANACNARPVTIERNAFGWGRSASSSNHYAGVDATNCHQLEIRDNLFDGTTSIGTLNPGSYAVRMQNAGGTIERNTIKLPRTSSSTDLAGVYATSAVTVTTIRDNTITGGDSIGRVDGLRLILNSVPMVISGNRIDVGPSSFVRGISTLNNPGGIRITDNFSRATGNKLCPSQAYGADVQLGPHVLERNRLFASRAGINRGGQVTDTTQSELYSNHFSSGTAECAGESTGLSMSSVSVYLSGNTIDVDADPLTTGRSNGVLCGSSDVIAEANVIGAGRAGSHLVLNNSGALCGVPASFTRNYFWHDHLTPTVDSSDGVLGVVGADAGTFDARGNLLANNDSPFDLIQPLVPDAGVVPRHRLSVGSRAKDRGPLPRLKDGTGLWLDLDQRPRDAGASADLGCCERY